MLLLLPLYKITPHLYDIIKTLLHYCILSKWYGNSHIKVLQLLWL